MPKKIVWKEKPLCADEMKWFQTTLKTYKNLVWNESRRRRHHHNKTKRKIDCSFAASKTQFLLIANNWNVNWELLTVEEKKKATYTIAVLSWLKLKFIW